MDLQTMWTPKATREKRKKIVNKQKRLMEFPGRLSSSLNPTSIWGEAKEIAARTIEVFKADE